MQEWQRKNEGKLIILFKCSVLDGKQPRLIKKKLVDYLVVSIKNTSK